MSVRSLGLRAATLAAATFATAALTALPAVADGNPADHTAATQQAQTPAAGKYKGRVIAKGGLYLRDKPTRGSRVVGLVRHGAIVHIFCKTRGDNVSGNNRWYLLTDGTWAWGSARYIENIGAVPRSC
jgi:uncharacterized protein YgiM (DUF1202 family)